MKTTYFLILNYSGWIVDYNLPFDLKEIKHIEDILPLYSHVGSYEDLIDLVIEAYEFSYDNIEYIVDVVLKKESDGFRVIVDDRTLVYKQKSIEQTKHNIILIEEEYANLRSKYLSAKNKYTDFALSAVLKMVMDSNERIKQVIEGLSSVNTYVKADKVIIENIVSDIHKEITYVENSISYSNIFNKIDPTSLLENADYLNLNELINHIGEDSSLNYKNIDLHVPRNTIIYGNKTFYKNLFSFYFDKSKKANNRLSIKAEQHDDHLLNIQILYYLEVKGFKSPQEFVQIFKVPINRDVETNTEIIEHVFGSLKNAILKQAYYINQTAA